MKKIYFVAVLLVCAMFIFACGDGSAVTSDGKKTDGNKNTGKGTVTNGAKEPAGRTSDDPADPQDPSDPFNLGKGGNDDNGGQGSKYVKVDPFGVDIPSNGGVNYEFRIYKGVAENGDEIDERYLPKKSWFISYHRSDCFISIPLSDNAIGTELFSIEPNFTKGTKEFTEYDDTGALGEIRVLRLNITSSSATIYDENENVTYYCSLYRTFTYTE